MGDGYVAAWGWWEWGVRTNHRLGDGEDGREGSVERLSNDSSELKMLRLIFSDGDDCRPEMCQRDIVDFSMDMIVMRGREGGEKGGKRRTCTARYLRLAGPDTLRARV